MNSMSRDHHNCNSNHSCRKDDKDHKDCRNEDRDHRDCRKEDRDHRDCRTIIKCGSIGSASIPKDSKPSSTFPLSSVKVDTSCLCNPITKLEFSSNYTIVVPKDINSSDVSISFQVSKACKGGFGSQAVGLPFILNFSGYKEDGPDPTTISSTFSFNICDCNSCFDDCCIYTITATPLAETDSTVNINNAQLISISTCGSDNCC